MNQIETIVPIESRDSVFIGRCGENLVRKVLFDIAPWLGQYGNDVNLTVVFERPDSTIYPLASTTDGHFCSVVISSNETAIGGPGYLEVRLYQGELLRKSQRFRTLCATSIAEPGQVPDSPTQGWIDQIMARLAKAQGESNPAALSLGRALLWDELGRLAVDVADEVTPDKTKPVSESYVDAVVGNIEILLKTL